jgi:hypothetical protein
MINHCSRLSAVFLFLGIVSVSGKDLETKEKGSAMQEKKEPILPFHLKISDLPMVEFGCEISSSKGEFGTETIRISGSTGVTLSRMDTKTGKVSELRGKIDPQALITLIRLFEETGFMEAEEENLGDPEGLKRTLALALPGRKKKVEIVGMESEESNRLIGAVKLAAGLGVPEALQRKFLNNL